MTFERGDPFGQALERGGEISDPTDPTLDHNQTALAEIFTDPRQPVDLAGELVDSAASSSRRPRSARSTVRRTSERSAIGRRAARFRAYGC